METKNSDVDKFNIWSKTYDESWLQQLYFDRIHRRVLNSVPSGEIPHDIVDIGCGTGRLLRKARRQYPLARLTGIDPADGMVRKARLMMPDAKFAVGAAESIPLPDASTDLVFSTVSFHHWVDQKKGLAEIYRILRPGGQFVFADVVPVPFLFSFMHHGQMRTTEEVRNLFEQTGFQIQSQNTSLLGHLQITVSERK